MTPILIPLARFEVRYELGSGRPYSELDRFMLEAIGEGASSIDDLHQTFRLKPRLLIEVLVTLARAGWVSIDVAQGGFSITALGRAALEYPDRLPPFSMIEKAADTIIMEMITGSVVPQNEVSYTNEFALRQSGAWEQSSRVPAGIDSDRLDAGQVISLLRRGQDQWVRSVETPVLTARGRNWLPVRVFPEAGRVLNLPDRWQRALAPLLIGRAAKSSAPRRAQEFFPVSESALNEWEEMSWNPEDLLLTHSQHVEALRIALCTAQQTVFVGSAFLDTSVLEGEPREWLLAALRRGVQVQLLWGYAARHEQQEEKAATAWLRRLRRDAESSGHNLRFSSEPTESHAKLLIYDPPEGACAVIGSFNWLSSPLRTTVEDVPGRNISLRLRHPRLVSTLAHTAAALWMSSRAALLSDAPERLRHLAAHLEKTSREQEAAPLEGTPCKARIVRDQEHDSLLRDLLLHAQRTALVCSHKVGPIALNRLAPLGAEPRPESPPRIEVIYGEASAALSEEDEQGVRQAVQAAGGALHLRPGTHSKIALADNRLIISSYNFLSADPFQTAARAREVGVLVECEALCGIVQAAVLGGAPSSGVEC